MSKVEEHESVNNLKRKFPSLAKPRQPLKETNSNIPSPHKRAKIESPGKQQSTQQPQQQPQPQPQPQQEKATHKPKKSSHQSKNNDKLAGDEMHEWQQSWRRIMKSSIVYFEGDQQSLEYRKAHKLLRLVGCKVTPFYDNNVTIIISKRPYDSKTEYSPHDIFSNVSKASIKVWNYDKVFRFLKYLGINIQTGVDELAVNTHTILPPSLTNNNEKPDLYNLLKEEKIYGSTDRDPNAKRDDLHYLGKNYLYVYDLTQTVRPIAIREWSDHYPVMQLSLDGKCPFIEDPTDQNSERKRLKRLRKFEANQAHREALRLATYKMINGISMSVHGFTATSTSTDKVDEEEDSTVKEPSEDPRFRQPLNRNSSCMQSKAFEAMASGYNGASNAVQPSMDSNLNSAAAMAGGNGLGPALSQVPSKQLNNLKRRILMKKKTTNTTEKKDKEHASGYCENCRVKYTNFDEHIMTNRHRNFACDDRNFQDIDELIASLRERKSLGNVISNGDYV
ncbi:DBF4-type domain-containing protein [Candida albicans]